MGLGSSSTTVVSILCVLLLESGQLDLSSFLTNQLPPSSFQLLSQLACDTHNAAQGRIGSGFDVITAVFGSCVFEKVENGCHHTPFCLPPHISLALSCGGTSASKTPVLVRRVREWRQQPCADALWRAYGENNAQIVRMFQQAREVAKENEVEQWMRTMKQLYRDKLAIMFQISEASSSDIVPKELYHILAETNEVKGVIGCMVAGAGGFDSFYCLYDERSTKISEIEHIWMKCGSSISTIHESKQGLRITSLPPSL